MSKPLSHQEQHVLQDNFDLFAEPSNQDRSRNDTDKTVARSAKKPRTHGRRKQNNEPAPKQPKKASAENRSDSAPHGNSDAKNKRKPKILGGLPPLDNLQPNKKGESYLGIRATSIETGVKQLENTGIAVDNYAMEKREITLKNVADALLDRGLAHRVDQRYLYWVLSSSEIDAPTPEQQKLIEVSINKAWFDAQKRHIRRLKGIAYLDACTSIARLIPLKGQSENQ